VERQSAFDHRLSQMLMAVNPLAINRHKGKERMLLWYPTQASLQNVFLVNLILQCIEL
jgi:hypothetical protein